MRTKDQNHALGIYTREEIEEPGELDNTGVLAAPQEKMTYEDLLSEVFQLPANCPACNAPCKVNTKLTSMYRNYFYNWKRIFVFLMFHLRRNSIL